MEMLHVLRNGRQQIQGGQSLDLETSPSQRINPTNGSARPSGLSNPSVPQQNGLSNNGVQSGVQNGAANGSQIPERPERPLLSRREATSPRQQLQNRPFAPDNSRQNS